MSEVCPVSSRVARVPVHLSPVQCVYSAVYTSQWAGETRGTVRIGEKIQMYVAHFFLY